MTADLFAPPAARAVVDYETRAIDALEPVRRRRGLCISGIIAASLAAGCAPAPALESADRPALTEPFGPSPSFVYTTSQTDPLADLLEEAAWVIQSDEFRDNLVEAAQGLDLRLVPKGAAVEPAVLARMLRGEHPGVGYATASAGWRWPGRSRTIIRRGVPVVQIKRSVRGLWASPSRESRSCAINTAAHEVSHTLRTDGPRFEFMISDRGYQNAPQTQHFASYLIGSVAQCTWLAQQGPVSQTLRECVEANGTRDYSPPAC